MDSWGIDGEDYIAAVRAGAIDPFGQTASELQESLDAFDRECSERIIAMDDAEIEAAATAGAAIPLLPQPPESATLERFRMDDEFVARLRAIERQSARIEGERRALLAAHMQRAIDLPGKTSSNLQEIAAMGAVALGLTTSGMVGRITDAFTIVHELSAAHRAAAEGRITVSHLRTIDKETRPLRLDQSVSAAETDRVVDALVDIAQRTSSSRLASRAKKIVNEMLTEPLQVRHDSAREQRTVEVFPTSDGMADLVARIPVLAATAILDRVTQAARKKSKDDPRTFDQFRADALQELLLAGVVPEDLHGVSPIKAQVAITIPATELLHDPVEQHPSLQALRYPAALDGKVLVDRETARRIAADTATWQRLFTDPVTGVPVTVDSYRPTKAQQHWLAGRDGRCRGPGCNRPALRADIDHTKDFAKGGTTSIGNLGHLCRSDHMLKHDTRWRVEQLPGGVMRWTSPIGQVIDDVPERAGPVFTDVSPSPSSGLAPF